MTIITRRMITVIGLVGIYVCLYTGWSQSQEHNKPKSAPIETQKNLSGKIDLRLLKYPYYEWAAKDTALAWVKKPKGAVAAVPLTGERHEERRISGADDVTDIGGNRPYALKMSPDGSKILYLMGVEGNPAGQWRVGTLDGTSYTDGALIAPVGRDLVWKRNSKEWVTLIGDNQHVSAVHYYIDGVAPPLTVPIQGFAPKRDEEMTYVPHILGLRRDGIAIVPVRDNKYPTKTIDFYLVDIEKGRVLSQKHPFAIPKGTFVWGMSVSHSGDRIAWLFYREVLRVTNGDNQTDGIVDIWLSNIDGTGLKRLTGFSPHTLGNNLPGQPYCAVCVECPIRWTIDDKAISCLEGNVLQIVKVK